METHKPEKAQYKAYTEKEGKAKGHSSSEIPPGLSEQDAAILRTVNRNAHNLDAAFHICCLRFGWAFLISFIPIIGDIAVAFLSYYLIIRPAKQVGLPPPLVHKMFLNNVVSVALSFVPIIGDILIGVWKVNLRNAALLEEFLRVRGEEHLKGGGHAIGERATMSAPLGIV